MTQPTPGPFELIIDDGRLIIVGSQTHGDIAEFFDCEESTVKTTREEALANARLFMAAEQLLKVVKWCVEFDGGECLADHPARLEKALLAIAMVEPVAGDERSGRVSGAAR